MKAHDLKQVILDITETEVRFRTTGTVNFDELQGACLTAILGGMENLIKVASAKETPETVEKLKGELYDNFNANASALLTLFAPEIEQHPDLTAQAILEMENELLDKPAGNSVEFAQQTLFD